MKKIMSGNLIVFDKNKENIDYFIQENWNEVWTLLRHNPELVKSNPKIKQAVINYEMTFFTDLDLTGI